MLNNRKYTSRKNPENKNKTQNKKKLKVNKTLRHHHDTDCSYCMYIVVTVVVSHRHFNGGKVAVEPQPQPQPASPLAGGERALMYVLYVKVNALRRHRRPEAARLPGCFCCLPLLLRRELWWAGGLVWSGGRDIGGSLEPPCR